jgi:MFS-type transporter involved in bile tolerance (Atg22 family)
MLFTVAGLAGIAVSITGNESASASAVLAALLVVLWNAAIYFDSWALTAGTAQAADKELRGATMGLHSMCGYAGGFIGPLGVGLVLDSVGSSKVWGVAFGHLALITLTGLFFLRRLGARSALQTLAATSG